MTEQRVTAASFPCTPGRRPISAARAAALVADLKRRLPADVLLDRPESTAGYRADQAAWAPAGTPAAVVRARTTEQVQQTVLSCIDHEVPVVGRGAGTGLSGAANAIDRCVVLSFERMNRVLAIDPLEKLAVVQPGVVNDDLRKVCAAQGLWYPPDPASSDVSTIGGNVNTNAGGICCVKYGVTGDYVLGLEMVTGTGEVVRLGRRTAKGVAGYDLTHLIVGSEGTLGLVTEVTVRLRPLRNPDHTVVGFFDSVVAAGEAVRLIGDRGVVPSALELVDRHVLRAVDEWKKMGLSAEADAILLARVDAPGVAAADEAAQVRACFDEGGATWSAVTDDEDEGEAFFAARRLAFTALERLGPTLSEDVCVPIGKVAQMLAAVEEIAARYDTRIANVAHAGDGNLHPLITTAPGDEEAAARAHQAFEEIIDAAIALGGTITGEHGVGLLKRRGLVSELGDPVIAMHRAVKDALDPHAILNPGKILCA